MFCQIFRTLLNVVLCLDRKASPRAVAPEGAFDVFGNSGKKISNESV